MSAEWLRFLRWTELGSTLFMTGLIWFVQVVHYPLLGRVGSAEYTAYQAAHMTRTTWVVAAPMLVEVGACAALVVVAGQPAWQRWPGVILLATVWLSTMLLQIPLHDILTRGFDPEVHARLVGTNWLRTVAWSLRGLLCLAAAWRASP